MISVMGLICRIYLLGFCKIDIVTHILHKGMNQNYIFAPQSEGLEIVDWPHNALLHCMNEHLTYLVFH